MDSNLIKVLLVDDHTLFREGLAELINKEPDMKCLGAFDNGQEAIKQAKNMEPDVVIIDIAMPG